MSNRGWLHLSRRVGESVRIGPDVWVKLVSIKHLGEARLAIHAPNHDVYREELTKGGPPPHQHEERPQPRKEQDDGQGDLA